jgi:HEAT repeat protein
MALNRVALTGIAAAMFVLPVALGLILARAVRRGVRRDEHRRIRRLAAIARAYARARAPAIALAEAASGATETEFWAAFEAHLTRLGRAERRRLGVRLERNRHVAAERRSLLAESPLRREMAARRLGLLPCPRSRRALRAAIGDAPEAVAYAAARALARDGDLRTLDWLLTHPELLAHRTTGQWAQLLLAFGRHALPRLREAVERGLDDPGVLRAAIEVLGLRRHAAAAPAIERRLRHDEIEVRIASARALGRIQAGPSSDALLHALRDVRWPVRAQAAWALGRLGRDEAVPALAICLTDRAWWVRRHAAYALAALGERGAAALRLSIQGSADPYARDIADEALRSIQGA